MNRERLYIITGSSKGLGKALVELLLDAKDVKIIGLSRSSSGIDDERFQELLIDLSDIKSFENHLDQIFPKGDFEEIVLINNAGWIGEISHVGGLSVQGIHDLFMLNTVTPLILLNEFVNRYRSLKNKRVVVNISSGAAKKAVDGWAAYCASKAALNMYSEIADLESEMDATGIRVFALAPGVVDTEMQSDIRKAKETSFSKIDKFLNLKANGELSQPKDAAKKIIHLILNSEQFRGSQHDVREY